jgi:arabinose-5-phosphate isomerase
VTPVPTTSAALRPLPAPLPPSADELVDRALAAADDALARSERAVAAVRPRFEAAAGALSLLLGVQGRVAVTGLGKSGLVGNKISATFASTGTPAFFVHAADALHGDAGMVAADDLLLAISKSGATAEVVQFAQMVKQRGVRVVAMTGCDGRSPLRRLADATIDIGVEAEADPWDLVPSTSTAVTAVVGDALAIALMVARGFGPDDFHVHHPGGALGERLSDRGATNPAEPA